MNLKKFIQIVLLFAVGLSSISFGAMTRSVDLRPNSQWWTGSIADQGWYWMQEAETCIEAFGLESQTTITFAATNGAILSNADNGRFSITEAGETLEFIFTSNQVQLGHKKTSVAVIDFNDVDQLRGIELVIFDSSSSPPATTEGTIYYNDDNQLYFRDNSGWVDLTAGAGTANTLDQAYDQGGGGAGRSIDADTGAVAITVSDTDNNVGLIVTQNDTTNDPTALQIVSAVDLADRIALDIDGQTTGRDIEGTGASFYVMGDGSIVGVDLDVTGAAGIVLQNDGAITNAVDTEIMFAENSEDISIDFQASGIEWKSGTGITVVAWGDLDDHIGLGTLVFDAAPSTIAVTADGAGDDLTISVMGAQDASIILQTNGTAADAMQFISESGGMDFTSSGAATDEDFDFSTSASMNFTTTEAVANQFKVDAQGAVAGHAIVLETTQGSIHLNADHATAGDIDIDPQDNATIAQTTAGSDVGIGNTSGDVDVLSDNVTITLTDAADNVLDILVGATELLSIDLGGTDAIDLGDASCTLALVSGDWGITSVGNASNMGSIGMDGGLTISNTTPPDVVLENTTAGSDADSGYFYWRGEDHDTSTDLDMSIFLDVTTSTDYKLSFMNDGAGAEVGSVDQGGNIQMDGAIDIDGAANIADTTADSDVLIGNATGDVAITSDNVTFTITDAADDAFQIVNSSTDILLDIDLGGTDGIDFGDASAVMALVSADWGITSVGNMSNIGSVGMDGSLTIANTTPPDIIMDNTTTGSDVPSGWIVLRGNDDNADDAIDMSMRTEVTTTTDYKLSIYEDGSDTEVMSVDQGGNVQLDGLLTADAGAAITGAAVDLNVSSNFAANIATGTSTGTVTIGGSGIQTVTIANGAAAKTLTLGSSNTTSTTNILAGSGGINITGSVVRTAQQHVQTISYCKVGATGGWVIPAAADAAHLATLPASQTNSTLIIPIMVPLKVGETITAWTINGQLDSAGNAGTLDARLYKHTEATGGFANATIGAGMGQVSQTADYKIVDGESGLSEVVAADESYYLLLTGTTAAVVDIEIAGITVTVSEI